MRVTSKGQVTIPAKMRRLAGFHPGTEVEFVFRDGEVVLQRAGGRSKGDELVSRLRGAFSRCGLSADEILAQTRGTD